MQCWPRKIQENNIDYFSVQSCLWTAGQHCTGNFHVQCWLRQIKITLSMVIFLQKDDYVVWANITPVIFLCNFISVVFGQHWLDCGLWDNIVCIGQVIVLCNAGASRPRQHCVGYFPAKTCLCDRGQFCTNSFLVRCCLTRIWTTLSMRYSHGMLSQLDRHNIE